MKKSLFIMAISVLSMQANAGLFDNLDKALGVLNVITGVSNTNQNQNNTTTSTTNQSNGSPGYVTDAMDQIPNLAEYKIPNKETSEYRVEDLVVQMKQPAFNSPSIVAQGKFYNKTKQSIVLTITIPVYDKDGFSRPDYIIRVLADANQKVKIDKMDRRADTNLVFAVDKITYNFCKGITCI